MAGHLLWKPGELRVEVYWHCARRLGGPWGAARWGFGLRRGNVDVDGSEGFEFHDWPLFRVRGNDGRLAGITAH